MDLADIEQIQRHAGADDIGDRIHRTHFMKMNFFDRHPVDPGFGVAQAPKHIRRVLFCTIGERRFVDHPQDVFQVTVAVTLIALLGRNHPKFRSRDAAAAGLLHLEFRTHVEALQSVDQRPGRRSRIQQRAHRHVSANTRKRVQVGDSHSLIIGGRLQPEL